MQNSFFKSTDGTGDHALRAAVFIRTAHRRAYTSETTGTNAWNELYVPAAPDATGKIWTDHWGKL